MKQSTKIPRGNDRSAWPASTLLAVAEAAYNSSVTSFRNRFWVSVKPLHDTREIPIHLRAGQTVTCRPFKVSDGPQLASLYLSCFSSPILAPEEARRFYSAERVLHTADKFDFRVLADQSGTVMAAIGTLHYAGGQAELLSLMVGEQFRGQGLARVLLSLEILRNVEHGTTDFYAFSIPMSQGIFMQLGFEETSFITRFLFSGHMLSLHANAVNSGLAGRAAKIVDELAATVTNLF